MTKGGSSSRCRSQQVRWELPIARAAPHADGAQAYAAANAAVPVCHALLRLGEEVKGPRGVKGLREAAPNGGRVPANVLEEQRSASQESRTRNGWRHCTFLLPRQTPTSLPAAPFLEPAAPSVSTTPPTAMTVLGSCCGHLLPPQP
jgi:hypothetical protein